MNEHFNNTFWSPSLDPIPNYTRGLSTLHSQLLESVKENEQMAFYIRRRIDSERVCAKLLERQQEICPEMNIMNPSLKNMFDMVRNESLETAHCHRVRASILSQEVLEPLEKFTCLFQTRLSSRKIKLDEEIDEFKHVAQSALLMRSVYWSRCRSLELGRPEYRPAVPYGFEEEADDGDEFIGGRKRSSSVTSELNVDHGGVKLGKTTVVPYREVARSMGRMQKMIEGYKSSSNGPRRFLGKDVFDWVRDYLASPDLEEVRLDDESLDVCRTLVALKFLRSVPKEMDGFKKDLYYEVQQNVVERYLRKTRIRHTVSDDGSQQQKAAKEQEEGVHSMTLEVPSSDGKGSTNSMMGGFLDRFKPNKGVDSTTKAQMEMEEADQVYKKKIKAVNKMRKRLEESILGYFEDMENFEKERIHAIKKAFTAMSNSLSNTLPMFKETYDKIFLFQESLKPEQDILYIIEQYKTGPYCPRPMVYENYYYGAAIEQTFGVPLEEVAQIYGSYVPPIVSKGIKLIDAGTVYYSKIS